MVEYSTKYDVRPHVIYSLLTGNHTFRVPNFQRDYVWGTKEKDTAKDRQVNAFFDDIYEASKQGDNYYIGSIITYMENDEHFLVDGQQRLTTLMILFAAFRDFQLNTPGIEEEKYPVSNPYLKFEQKLPGSQKMVHKLAIANTAGSEFLKDLINGFSIEDIDVRVGSEQMYEAYNFCKIFFENLGNKEATAFIDYILKNVELSWIVASDMQSAFVVFERMNDRGKDLLVSDKFKYLLFAQSDEDLGAQSSEINQVWEGMKKTLQKAENTKKDPKFERFLSYFMVSRFLEDKWLGASQLYSYINNKKTMEAIGLTKPKEFLKMMEKDLELHANFLNGLNNDGTSNKNLQTIKSYASDVRQHIPMLIAAHAGGVSKSEFDTLTAGLERLVFALKISGAQWNVVNTLVPKWCTVLRNKEMSIEKFIAVAVDPEIVKRVDAINTNLTMTSNLNTTLIKYVLEKTNEIICTEAGEPISTTMVIGRKNSHTIEHILPINFPDSAIHPKSDRISTEKLLWRLGNLTLLERVSNSKLQDNDVKTKYEMGGYIESNIVLSNILRKEGFSGPMGKKHKEVVQRFSIKPIKLEQDTYWTEKQIAARETMYFKVLSEFFGTELKPVT